MWPTQCRTHLPREVIKFSSISHHNIKMLACLCGDWINKVFEWSLAQRMRLVDRSNLLLPWNLPHCSSRMHFLLNSHDSWWYWIEAHIFVILKHQFSNLYKSSLYFIFPWDLTSLWYQSLCSYNWGCLIKMLESEKWFSSLFSNKGGRRIWESTIFPDTWNPSDPKERAHFWNHNLQLLKPWSSQLHAFLQVQNRVLGS